MATQNIGRVRGTAYKIVKVGPQGVVLEFWKKNTTFRELDKLHHGVLALMEMRGVYYSDGYYLIVDTTLHPGITNPDTGLSVSQAVAILVVDGADKNTVLAQLRQIWGPETQFHRVN